MEIEDDPVEIKIIQSGTDNEKKIQRNDISDTPKLLSCIMVSTGNRNAEFRGGK